MINVLFAAADMLSPNRPGNAGVRVNWTGDADVAMDQNTFILAAGSNNQTGVEIDIDGLADVSFTNSSSCLLRYLLLHSGV